jgi:hypothetical protein
MSSSILQLRSVAPASMARHHREKVGPGVAAEAPPQMLLPAVDAEVDGIGRSDRLKGAPAMSG